MSRNGARRLALLCTAALTIAFTVAFVEGGERPPADEVVHARFPRGADSPAVQVPEPGAPAAALLGPLPVGAAGPAPVDPGRPLLPHDLLPSGEPVPEPPAGLTELRPDEAATGALGNLPEPERSVASPRAEEPPLTLEVPRDADREEDLRRFRGRYRYAGPIPTPAEWEPPEGPVKIALQAGHWLAMEAPDELAGIRGNGTRWEDVLEWQTNLEIARRAGAALEELGYEVEILPAVVPPGYRAHLFISIHADGSPDSRASGYRVAAPRRDATGRAEWAAEILSRSYGEVTGIPLIPSTTRRMRGYYAFNFRRYEHALHPMTIGVILETGFLTSARDRRVLIDDPDRAARGIVEAVKVFPLTPPPRAASEPTGAATRDDRLVGVSDAGDEADPAAAGPGGVEVPPGGPDPVPTDRAPDDPPSVDRDSAAPSGR